VTPNDPAKSADGQKAISPIAEVPDPLSGTNPDSGGLAMLFCPACDSRLVSLRCKLLCERCGYFMSCADYY
jgi:hypothetical protein